MIKAYLLKEVHSNKILKAKTEQCSASGGAMDEQEKRLSSHVL
jgi:hypothetical protein